MAGNEKAGIYVRADVASLAKRLGDDVSRARKNPKTNNFYKDLTDLLEVASRQNYTQIRLYAPQDPDYESGNPENFAAVIKGDFDAGKIAGEIGALKSPLCDATFENGLAHLRFNFITEKNYDEIFDSIGFESPVTVRMAINFIIGAMTADDKKFIYSVVIPDNKTIVFGSEKLVARIVREKNGAFEKDCEPGDYIVYFKNPGKIIDSIASRAFDGALNKNVKNIEMITLAHDSAGGAFEARISFGDPACAAEISADLENSKKLAAYKLFAVTSVSPAMNLKSTDEVVLQFKNVLDSLAIKRNSSNEVALSFKYPQADSLKYDAFFNDAAAIVACAAVSIFQLNYYNALATRENEESKKR